MLVTTTSSGNSLNLDRLTDRVLSITDVYRVNTEVELTSAIAGAKNTILIDGDITLTGNHTVTQHLVIRNGAVITTDSNDLTINGPFAHPPVQCFSGSGVTFGIGAIVSAYLEWWGGAGDNSTINSTMWTYAVASGTQRIDLLGPDTTYLIDSTNYFRSNLSLYFNHATVKVADSSGDNKRIFYLYSAGSMMSNCAIYGPGTVDGNVAGQGAEDRWHGIDIIADNVIVAGLTVKNIASSSTQSLGDGIKVSYHSGLSRKPSNIHIEHNYVYGCERQEITIESGDGVWVNNNYVVGTIDAECGAQAGNTIINAHIEDNTVTDGAIYSVSSVSGYYSENVFICRNILDNSHLSISKNKVILVEGNIILGDTLGYINMQETAGFASSDRVTIRGNTVINSPGLLSGDGGGIVVRYPTTDDTAYFPSKIIIEDNKIINCGATSSDYSIYVTRVNDVVIRGNVVEGGTAKQIYVVEVQEKLVLTDNICYDGASGTNAIETAMIRCPAFVSGNRTWNDVNTYDIGIRLYGTTNGVLYYHGDTESHINSTTPVSQSGWTGRYLSRYASSFTISSGTSYKDVSNGAFHTGCFVLITPTNNAAGALMADPGFYRVTASDVNGTSFRVGVVGGANAPADCTFNYVLLTSNAYGVLA